jgi:hypothetical protein
VFTVGLSETGPRGSVLRFQLVKTGTSGPSREAYYEVLAFSISKLGTKLSWITRQRAAVSLDIVARLVIVTISDQYLVSAVGRYAS